MSKQSSKYKFGELNNIDVNKYTEKKGKFTYLSWAWAVRELLKVAPDATWVVHTFGGDETKRPYMSAPSGHYVQVTVTVDGVERTQVHPVLDNRNQALDNPNAFQVNTSIQRCLAKAIALHGLGLYIYAGEDLPSKEAITPEQAEELLVVAKKISDDKMKEVNKGIKDMIVHTENYAITLSSLQRRAEPSVLPSSMKIIS